MTVVEHDLAAWLRTLPDTRAEPLRVCIDDVWMPASYYRQQRATPLNSRAWHAGERTYEQRGYYVLGALPASYLRDSNTVYVAPAPPTRYYVASWFEGTNEHHPFGPMFQLFEERGLFPEHTERPMRVLADQSPRPPLGR